MTIKRFVIRLWDDLLLYLEIGCPTDGSSAMPWMKRRKEMLRRWGLK
jgi:hypothetical protein